MMTRNSALIIPALDPDERLLPYVEGLIANGFSKIILVDDGSSDDESGHIFNAISSLPECDLLVHAVNMGKGRSLKDAFNFYCQNYAKDFLGVITADADGQHTIEDVARLDTALRESPETLILGVRDFDGPSVPFKSKFGNKATKHVMRFFIGGARRQDTGQHSRAISDTQTGLRAIPNRLLKGYLTLGGERFEYETNMLIEALHSHTPIGEITIQTVYINENSGTHFRPMADSAAIYGLIFSMFLKYTLASLSAFFIDYGIYSLLVLSLGFLPLALKIWTATAAARALSSFYNYTVNRAVVFQDTKGQKKTLAKYYALCILQLCCSALSVWAVCRYTYLSEVTAKLFVDMLLFAVSFHIQKNWVFGEGRSYKAIGFAGRVV